MGFVPIFLALGGFIFLWAIVNYNTLKRQFVRMQELGLQVKKLKENIHTEVKQLETCCIPEFEAKLEHILEHVKSDADAGRLELYLNEFNKSYDEAYKDEGTAIQEVIRKDLSKDVRHLVSVKKEYLASVKSYNKIVTEKPSSFIAMAFGFKKVVLS
jgi:hypothetical protein